MNVLVLVPAILGTSPGQRFRWEQWARYLEPEGIRFTFAPFEDECLHRTIYRSGQFAAKATLMLRALRRRLALLNSMNKYDVVVVYREATMIGPAVVEAMLAWRGVPLVFDFDDPIWLPYRSPTNGFLSRLKFPGKTASICRFAQRVMVGNRLLGQWARQHAREVDIVPSTIDLQHYPVAAETTSAKGTVTLGWTGSHSTLPFLQGLWGTLEKLAALCPFRLVVISHTDAPPLKELSAEIIPKRWQAATEATDLQDIDIGLAPFPDSGWTPWRCHGKVLQYMAAGIPCIASRVGILPDYIQDGSSGLLAGTDDEWLAKLALLIRDGNLRRRLGLAGRRRIEDDYSANVWAPRVGRILEQAAGLVSGRPERCSNRIRELDTSLPHPIVSGSLARSSKL